ncbi:MAG: radical SAM-associated putative lipoprotein [Carboxylicivirga sp.]|jgi:putative lipoprotein (rSAM/lipoprotein system)|nr:radical SAM-associated putative lipoprotein [Carboxylicivirga sp.]
MKKNLIRKIIGGLSFTSALFVFQACYGTPQDFGQDVLIEGQVKSKSTGRPIKGIKVVLPNENQYQLTDEDGKFSVYTYWHEEFKLRFQDIDEEQNGQYAVKDTVLKDVKRKEYLDIVLEDKE